MTRRFNGIVDMHVHSAPDVRARKHDDLQLLEAAQLSGLKALVLKSHHFPTSERASLLNQLYPEVKTFGSITLNEAVGGLNPKAVEVTASLGGKIVWLPTIDAENHRRKAGITGGVRLFEQGKPVSALCHILEIIADRDLILATGHISSVEMEPIIREAFKRGVQKVVITHPEYHIVNVSLKQQQELVSEYPVYFERTFAQPLKAGVYKMNMQTNIEAIHRVGYESTIISTDSGQLENPDCRCS
ncbi:DUF6282 family protein [Geomicrobium sp. JCM 19039]|uniref:DUF6282 family protein n=1 Tax=Geomicrobium sp. JCM 19039 TaxID=1460636 RepID=UPI00045F2FCA|nr:DUF6282 family protein [Geomicrobium sp. JCM 19039]GAK12368.1 hypothetical protein JCM19039_2136 [Geomicrobium sp. JCM 19039]